MPADFELPEIKLILEITTAVITEPKLYLSKRDQGRNLLTE